MFSKKTNENVNEPSPKLRQIPSQICLGIWGFPEAGKSVYMFRLFQELSDQARLVPSDKTTAKYIYKGIKRLEKGEFVGTTSSQERSKYSYTIENKDNSKTKLTFFDLSGEFFQDPEKTFSLDNNRKVSVVDYLLECHGILFLLSPLVEDIQSVEESYYILLTRLFNLMRVKSPQNRLEQYVAFGITKIDHPEVNLKCLKEQYKYPEQMFLEILDRGPDAKLMWLKNYFYTTIEGSKNQPRLKIDPTSENRCQLFYISPFGTYKDTKGNIQSYVVPNEEEKQKNNTLRIEKYSMSSKDDLDLGNFGNKNNNTEEPQPNKYKIDRNRKVSFNPTNLHSPIDWLIRGIKEHPPNIPNTSSANSNT